MVLLLLMRLQKGTNKGRLLVSKAEELRRSAAQLLTGEASARELNAAADHIERLEDGLKAIVHLTNAQSALDPQSTMRKVLKLAQSTLVAHKKDGKQKAKLSAREREVLEYMDSSGVDVFAAVTIGGRFGLSAREAAGILGSLVDKGFVRSERRGHGHLWYKRLRWKEIPEE